MDELTQSIVRAPAEIQYAEELSALQANDKGKRPPGWRLSPVSVRLFIAGSGGKALAHTWRGAPANTIITRKFYGDDVLVERSIVTLLGNRGLLLVGEPGTAKSMLSELLAAAISGDSTNTIQGTAGTTEDQIKYSWNYALLLAEGPSTKALVPSPLYTALKKGCIVRFEEITRCQPEIQDALVSVMSEKAMMIPELGDGQSILHAAKGFNVLATANLRDRGVNEMSSALKRRFNFETVPPIRDKQLEMRLVQEQTERLLKDVDVEARYTPEVMELLVTTFQELRNGRTEEGAPVDKPTTVMSTAEAVAVGFSAGLDACYFGDGEISGEHIARQMLGTAFKDDPEDAKKLRQYFDVVVKSHSRKSRQWKTFYEARKWLG